MNLGGATRPRWSCMRPSIAAGMAGCVACVFADNSLNPPSPSKARARAVRRLQIPLGLNAHYGLFGVNDYMERRAAPPSLRNHQRSARRYRPSPSAVGQLNPEAQFFDTPCRSPTAVPRGDSLSVPLSTAPCSNGGLAVIGDIRRAGEKSASARLYIRMAQDYPGGNRWKPWFPAY
jgi:hypothetical protein